MGSVDNHQVNYWAGGINYEYEPTKPGRSIKKKLFIVFSFIFILAITPTIIYTLVNMDFSNSKQVSVVPSQVQTDAQQENSEPKVYKVTIEEPKKSENETTVLANDNYWKITKRVCGEGNNYLSVKEQNEGKALHEGDTVTINCNL